MGEVFDFRKPEAALSNCRSSPFGSQKQLFQIAGAVLSEVRSSSFELQEQPFHELKATLSEAKRVSMRKGIDEDHPSPTITNFNARAFPEAFPFSGGSGEAPVELPISSGDFLREGRALPHGQTGSCVGSSSNKRSADSISSSSNHVLSFAFALTFTSSDTWPQIFLST